MTVCDPSTVVGRREYVVERWEQFARAAYEGYHESGPGALVLRFEEGERVGPPSYQSILDDGMGIPLLDRFVDHYDPEREILVVFVLDEERLEIGWYRSGELGKPTPGQVWRETKARGGPLVH